MPKTPVTAALLAALSQEVRPFLRRVQAQPLPALDFPAWEVASRGGKAVALIAGIGEGAAARAAAFILRDYQPQVLISLGFGGGLTPELPAGALVLGETFWRYEPETGALQELAQPSLPVALGDLVDSLQTSGLPIFRGSVVTTPAIIHKRTEGGPLLSLPHPVLDLETASLAALARSENLPLISLRAVTDTCGEEIPEFIREAVRQGAPPTAKMALAWLAGDPRRLAALMRLWRRSRLAAEHLAQALAVVLEML
jgi:adenosylhomocysteine nucleosidase